MISKSVRLHSTHRDMLLQSFALLGALELIIVFCINTIHCLDNGLALTPPMGWMTWERFRCNTDCEKFPEDCISEKLIRRTARAMSSNGYKKAGYEYIILDDCWPEMERDAATNKLVPDRKRFPSGLKHLSNYIHSLGLKFGLYQDYGTKTCGGYPGIIGFEEIDAQSFADWGVDYVKLDGCNSDVHTMDRGYSNFGALLNKTGRPMVYSCSWPVYQESKGIKPNFTLIKQHCNLWRNWDDIQDSWDSVKEITKYFGVNQARIAAAAGPGHWNDPDMLLLGNFGLSLEQSRAQMAMWAILSAPLIMSNDLDHIDEQFKDILLNRDVIAVNQDPLGIQGLRVLQKSDIEIWTRPLQSKIKNQYDYGVAVVSLRTDGRPFAINILLTDIHLDNKAGYQIKDLYNSSKSTQRLTTELHTIVNPSGCRFYKFTTI